MRFTIAGHRRRARLGILLISAMAIGSATALITATEAQAAEEPSGERHQIEHVELRPVDRSR